MRFGIHDAFHVLTLATFYSAMAGTGLFGSLEEFKQRILLVLVLQIPVAAFFWWLFGRIPTEAGQVLGELRVRQAWASHYLVAIVTLLCSLFFCFVGEDNLEKTNRLLSSTPQVLVQAYVALLCTRAFLCEQGVALCRKYWLYSVHPMTIVRNGRQDELIISSAMKWRWIRLLIPEDLVSRARATLASTEEPPMNADQRG